MRSIGSIALAAALLAGPAFAQAQPPEESWLPDRLDRALRDMMQDMEPAIEQAFEYMRSFGAIDDPRHYDAPEVLPNGDIIIRRREDAPELHPDAPAEPRNPATDLPRASGEGVWT